LTANKCQQDIALIVICGIRFMMNSKKLVTLKAHLIAHCGRVLLHGVMTWKINYQDEYIDDFLVANEYQFTIDGGIFK